MDKRITAAVDAIIFDLSSRRGLKQEWDQIDVDIIEEIKATWAHLVNQALNDEKPPKGD
jgi:hypothetical protein